MSVGDMIAQSLVAHGASACTSQRGRGHRSTRHHDEAHRRLQRAGIERRWTSYASYAWQRNGQQADARAYYRQIGAICKSPDRTSALRDLWVPALVVHGDVDRMVHPSGGLAMARAIASASCGAGVHALSDRRLAVRTTDAADPRPFSSGPGRAPDAGASMSRSLEACAGAPHTADGVM